MDDRPDEPPAAPGRAPGGPGATPAPGAHGGGRTGPDGPDGPPDAWPPGAWLPYGGPSYPPPEPGRSVLPWVLGGVAALLVLLVAGAVFVAAAVLGVFEASDDEVATLVTACQDGSMAACDELWWATPVGSEEEELGATCGGRAAPREAECEERFGSRLDEDGGDSTG